MVLFGFGGSHIEMIALDHQLVILVQAIPLEVQEFHLMFIWPAIEMVKERMLSSTLLICLVGHR